MNYLSTTKQLIEDLQNFGNPEEFWFLSKEESNWKRSPKGISADTDLSEYLRSPAKLHRQIIPQGSQRATKSTTFTRKNSSWQLNVYQTNERLSRFIT